MKTSHPSPRTVNPVGKNNCLFAAAITYMKRTPSRFERYLTIYGGASGAQTLRDACTVSLREDGLPTIPDGKPAGEQYLNALSKVLRSIIEVDIEKTGKTYRVIDTDAQFPSLIRITHAGSRRSGHWKAFTGVEPTNMQKN